ncbi:MAG: phosphoglycerate dehydrogenase [Deltaproteobacteria bacterium]|nr:phosphoglycerate dehydrogenase [Deltaproteobacteria bacterium]
MPNKSIFYREPIKVLLLENIHSCAKELFENRGYVVREIPRSLSAEELAEEIVDINILGIRSKTKVTQEHLERASELLAIGCFGVGTNQVPLEAASKGGVAVFNAPFSSTRSVAELAVGNMIALARRIADSSAKMHNGLWEKSASNCIEVRNKVIGIVGYGHIGQQVGLLAEAVGLHVIFFDQLKKLPLGRAKPVSSFSELLQQSDFVSLHVPAKKDSRPLMDVEEFGRMKKGSYLINLGRGNLVNLQALKQTIASGHIAGAAIDVYPKEPSSNKEEFRCELAGVENIILTPHIGGSTREAQRDIGLEVSSSLIDFVDTGNSLGAVNFPEASLTPSQDTHRILNVHSNVPGVLTHINEIVSSVGANVEAQYLVTRDKIGYLIMDLNKELSKSVSEMISKLPTSIKTRVLY